LAKNSSFGFSAFACISAKTKCAICAVGFFSMAYNVLGMVRVPKGMHYT
jgi:hypothetical protein